MPEGKSEEGAPCIIRHRFSVPSAIPKHTSDIQQEHVKKKKKIASLLNSADNVTLLLGWCGSANTFRNHFLEIACFY